MKRRTGQSARPSFARFFIQCRTPLLFSACSAACLIHCGTVKAVLLMHGSELSTFAASVPFLLLVHKRFQTICLNKSQVFQHTHVIFCAVSFIQRLQPFARVFGTFKTERLFVFALLNGTILAGFSFSTVTTSMAGKAFPLVCLAQRTVHSTGRHNLLLGHPFSPDCHACVFAVRGIFCNAPSSRSFREPFRLRCQASSR